MSYTPEQLFSFLDSLGIEHQTASHQPVFTVDEARAVQDQVSGAHSKNLFLKDAKGASWLVVMLADKRADLAGIARRVGAAKFSFAKPELLADVLGLTPGSVTPFALVNDKEKRVTVVLDGDMLKNETIHFHPLHNAASTTIRAADLLKFVQALGYEPIVVECGCQQAGNNV